MDDFNNKDFFTVPKEGEEPGSDWIRAEKNGKYSKVRLEQGNNVIMMKAGKHTRYFVIAATGLNIKSENLSRKGKSFAKGDKVKVHLEGLQLPVPSFSISMVSITALGSPNPITLMKLLLHDGDLSQDS